MPSHTDRPGFGDALLQSPASPTTYLMGRRRVVRIVPGLAPDAFDKGTDFVGSRFPRRLGFDNLQRCSLRRVEAEHRAAAFDDFCD